MVWGLFYDCNKMELTLDKSCVGQAGGTGCVSECLRESCGSPMVGSWPEKGRISSSQPRGSYSSCQCLKCR